MKRLGEVWVSFFAHGKLCRESYPINFSDRARRAFRVERNEGFYYFGIRQRKLKRKPIRKLEVNGELLPIEVIAAEIEKHFGSGRRLLGVRLQLVGTKECWINSSFLDEFQEFEKSTAKLDAVKNNGGGAGAVKFFEKLMKLEAIYLASKLNLEMDAVQEVFSAVQAESKNFENA